MKHKEEAARKQRLDKEQKQIGLAEKIRNEEEEQQKVQEERRQQEKEQRCQ
jgi:hypothetical protein